MYLLKWMDAKHSSNYQKYKKLPKNKKMLQII